MKHPAELMQKSLIEKHNLIIEAERYKAALAESLKLQSHYAGLLNQYDGGKRIQFSGVEQWLERLKTVSDVKPYSKDCLAHDIPGASCQKPNCDC